MGTLQNFSTRHPVWTLVIVVLVVGAAWLILAPWPPGLEQAMGRKRVFLNAILSGITLGALYFLVASGFTLVFGLMRNVNLAHGSLYLLGGYIGFGVVDATGYWLLAFPVVFIVVGALGLLLQHQVFRRMEGEELRQTLVTIGISIVLADLMLWYWGGQSYQVLSPSWLSGPMTLPLISSVRSNGQAVYLSYPQVRIAILIAAIVIGFAMWFVLNRSRLGMLIRAGVDDRDILAASGVRIQYVFLAVFAFGAGMAGMAGIIGGTFQSLSPGEDTRFLLASLVVVIVGGMGSIPGAALGAVIIGLAEQIGLVYAPTYSVVFTFLIMALVLAFRRRVSWERSADMTDVMRTSAPGKLVLIERIPPPVWVIGLVLLTMPAFASNFVLYQIFGWSFILGMIALSLMVLAGYGGMVSLIQMTVAAVAGYVVAILGTSGVTQISLGWPWWLYIPLAILIAALFGTLVGTLAVRTEGIYTIMITLAIAAAFFYFARQNYGIFNGYTGFNNVIPPPLFGIDWRQSVPFYYLSLGCAALSYGAVVWMARTPFGLALQGVRDNPRRMSALGFSVTAHRIVAYTFASVIAAVGGILLVWQNAQVVPGTAGIPQVIDILVIAVVVVFAVLIGPFIGALIYTILSVFSSDILHAFGMSGERFKLVIGLGFLAVVFFSPDGVLGLWDRYKARRDENRDPRWAGSADDG